MDELRTFCAIYIPSKEMWLVVLVLFILIGCGLAKVLTLTDKEIKDYVRRGQQ